MAIGNRCGLNGGVVRREIIEPSGEVSFFYIFVPIYLDLDTHIPRPSKYPQIPSNNGKSTEIMAQDTILKGNWRVLGGSRYNDYRM